MPTMPRGLDHIAHGVRDLDAAELYRRLGFTVGARNRHSWGTHNHVVQFPGFFIELLTFAEPDKLGGDGFSILFGGYNCDFIEEGEGRSCLWNRKTPMRMKLNSAQRASSPRRPCGSNAKENARMGRRSRLLSR